MVGGLLGISNILLMTLYAARSIDPPMKKKPALSKHRGQELSVESRRIRLML